MQIAVSILFEIYQVFYGFKYFTIVIRLNLLIVIITLYTTFSLKMYIKDLINYNVGELELKANIIN